MLTFPVSSHEKSRFSSASESSSHSIDSLANLSTWSSQPSTPPPPSLTFGNHPRTSATSSLLRNEWLPDLVEDKISAYAPHPPYILPANAGGLPSPTSAPSALSILPTKSEKCTYFCITGVCRDTSHRGSRASYSRHEKEHWFRYACTQCHENIDSLLDNIGCQCKVASQPGWFHLESHRLTMGSRDSQERTKLYQRKDALELHLKKVHELSGEEAHRQASESKVQVRQVAACGFCEHEPLFYDWSAVVEHMWKHHWQQGHDMSAWCDNRVVRKLLTLQPNLLQCWNTLIQLSGRGHSSKSFTWQRKDLPRLRLELEAGLRRPSDLASMVYEHTSFSNAALMDQQGREATQVSKSYRNSVDMIGETLADQTNSFMTTYNAPPQTVGYANDSAASLSLTTPVLTDPNAWQLPFHPADGQRLVLSQSRA